MTPNDQAHLPAHAGRTVMPRDTDLRVASQVQRLVRLNRHSALVDLPVFPFLDDAEID